MWVVNEYTSKHLENRREYHSLLPRAETQYHLYVWKCLAKQNKIKSRMPGAGSRIPVLIKRVLRCYVYTVPAGDTIREPS